MIDTHSHMYADAFDDDRATALQRAREAGVTRILCPAIDSGSHEAMIALCRSSAGLCLPMMGLHPTCVNDNPGWERELEIVEAYLAGAHGAFSSPGSMRFCAVGEAGLDLHWSRDFLAEQTIAFERQIDLALRYDLPLAIHTREAWPETIAILEKYSGCGLRGVLHAFSGTIDDYRRARTVGEFAVGVGGPVTYKKNRWPELLPAIDPCDIVLETDAPWLPPTPHRGERNESSYLPLVLAAAASILGISPPELDDLTTANASRIFRIFCVAQQKPLERP